MQPALRYRSARGGMANLHHLRMQTEALTASAMVDLLVLPESFSGVPPEDGDPGAATQAEQFLSTLARVCGVSVVGGSIPPSWIEFFMIFL